MLITVAQYLTYLLSIWLLSIVLIINCEFQKLKYVFTMEEMLHLI
jgi:hypothetical protein